DEIEQQVEAAISRLLALILEMSERESDFVFKSVFATTIRLAHYNPIGGSSYIKTPVKLANKQAIINVKNKDSKCFLYAIALAVFPTDKNADRPNKYKKYLSSFTIDDLTFPLDLKQISKFEELNPHITVHVQCYNVDNEIVPLVTSKNIRQKNKIINLFLLSEEKTEIIDGKSRIVRKDHYTWI